MKRVVLILIIVGVIAAAVGAVALYLWGTTPQKQLARAELALRAGNHDRALELARSVAEAHPGKWQAHFIEGRALIQLARYDEAREPLRRAVEIEPEQSGVALAIARTHSVPARQVLGSEEAASDAEAVRGAVEQLRQAIAVLEGVPAEKPEARLDVTEALGRARLSTGQALHMLRRILLEEAAEAEEAGRPAVAAEKRQAAQQAADQGDTDLDLATDDLGDVVKGDPGRSAAVRAFITACRGRQNREAVLDVVSALGLSDHRAGTPLELPPLAVALLLRDQLALVDPTERDTYLARTAETLDDLIAEHEDAGFHLDRVRLPDAAAEAADALTVEEAATKLGALLEADPDYAEAILLRANVAAEISFRPDLPGVPQDAAIAESCAKAVADAENVGAEIKARSELLIGQTLAGRGEWLQAEEVLGDLVARHAGWVQAHLAYARAAEMAGNRERARRSLQAVIQIAPNHAEARRNLAAWLLSDALAEPNEAAREGLYRAAFQHAKAYYEARPHSADALQLYVQTAVRSDRPATAREAVRQADALEPDRPAMIFTLADSYGLLARRGIGPADQDRRRARELLQILADSQPEEDDVNGHLAKAQALLRLGRSREAEHVLDRTVERFPESASARYRLGQLYQATNRSSQAAEQFREASRLAPSNLSYRLALAQALLGSGQLERCEEVCRAILETAPGNRNAKNLLTNVRLRRGEITFEETAAHQELLDRGGLRLAAVHLRRGELEKCIEICRDELAQSPDSVAAHHLLARAYMAGNQEAKAVQELKTLIGLDPGRLAYYVQLGIVLGKSESTEGVRQALAAVEGARPHRVDMAMGMLLERGCRFDSATEAYGRVIESRDAEMAARAQARMGRARALAQAGHVDLARLELDRLSREPAWREVALVAKAQLLIAARRAEPAKEVLQELRSTPEPALALLGRVAGLYARLGEFEVAEEVCNQAIARFPDDAQSYATAAEVALASGRLERAAERFRQAISVQPGNYKFHLSLARTLAAQQKPEEALRVLEELKDRGDVAEASALFAQADLASRWGLHGRAVALLEAAAQTGQADRTRVRLALGRAFAALGKKERARDELGKIPSYASEYLAARQVLAELADSDEARLAILDDLQERFPGQESILIQRMSLLRRAGRPAEAVQQFRAFLAERGERAPVPPRIAEMALGAAREAGDRVAAGDLAADMARRTGLGRWADRAVLLMLEDRPDKAQALLPEPSEASIGAAALGLCVALRQGTDPAPWADRVAQIHRQLSEAPGELQVARRLRVLVALAAERPDEARQAIETFETSGPGVQAAAEELVESASGRPDATEEAAALLEATVASIMGLNDLAVERALEVLEARPTCRFAALIAAGAGPEEAELRRVVETLRPDDGLVAKMLRGQLRMLQDRFREAAVAYGEAADAAGDDLRLRFQQAAALETAGDLDAALPLYVRIWEQSQDPVAANNAAYLTAQLHPEDPEKLAEALEWAEAACTARPRLLSFLDTKGWLAHLLGGDEEALPALRRAVGAYPTSTQVHYHLGVVEAEAGSPRLARWHLEAAVDLGDKARDEGRSLSPSESEAVRLAREALRRLDGSES